MYTNDVKTKVLTEEWNVIYQYFVKNTLNHMNDDILEQRKNKIKKIHERMLRKIQ